MVEYIIIVVVIAITSLVVIGYFGDAIKKKFAGAVATLDEDLGKEVSNVAPGDSLQQLKTLDPKGIQE